MLDSFHGVAGVYVRSLETNKIAAVNADTIFPTASIVKVPILVGIFDKINKGQLSYHQSFVYHDSLAKAGSGLMQFFKDSTPVTLDVLSALMISYSDNTAALWCQGLVGGAGINNILDSLGLKKTRVNSFTKGREINRKEYGWGQTTPREMAELLAMIRDGKVVSPVASEEMYRLMSHIFYDGYALSQIPPYVQVAAKQGMVNDSRSELVLVNAPHGDYVFYIATKNIKDQSWNDDSNEAWNLQRKVSALLWNYFEPKSGWKVKAAVK
ncbi:MAG TPA: serine hydrolase [Arachidicoccus sp.]